LVTEVLHIRSALPLLAFGALGAGISVASLVLSSTDGSPSAFGRLIAEPLPNVVFVAAAGFGAGGPGRSCGRSPRGSSRRRRRHDPARKGGVIRLQKEYVETHSAAQRRSHGSPCPKWPQTSPLMVVAATQFSA
jgi:hypothetical protein